jgi:PPK2 family polyphosphate:nucleotide phosphotransferase
MPNTYTSEFKVKPGTRVKLAKIDPDYHGSHVSRSKAAPVLKHTLAALTKMQYRMWAEGKHSLLIVLQGFDSAGKDSVTRHIFGVLNPQGCSVAHFGEPTLDELAHDFLWRVHAKTPAKGMITIFNRSHYEDVLISRVCKLVPEKQWEKRYKEIRKFEQLLHDQNNTSILKFFLYISKEEQLARFAKRLGDPSKQWKISEADYQQRQYWDAYIEAYEDALGETSTDVAPWFIIPSNHKWFCHLAVSQIFAEAMDAMNIKLPKPAVDLDDIRRKYHSAKKADH